MEMNRVNKTRDRERVGEVRREEREREREWVRCGERERGREWVRCGGEREGERKMKGTGGSEWCSTNTKVRNKSCTNFTLQL